MKPIRPFRQIDHLIKYAERQLSEPGGVLRFPFPSGACFRLSYKHGAVKAGGGQFNLNPDMGKVIWKDTAPIRLDQQGLRRLYSVPQAYIPIAREALVLQELMKSWPEVTDVNKDHFQVTTGEIIKSRTLEEDVGRLILPADKNSALLYSFYWPTKTSVLGLPIEGHTLSVVLGKEPEMLDVNNGFFSLSDHFNKNGVLNMRSLAADIHEYLSNEYRELYNPDNVQTPSLIISMSSRKMHIHEFTLKDLKRINAKNGGAACTPLSQPPAGRVRTTVMSVERRGQDIHVAMFRTPPKRGPYEAFKLGGEEIPQRLRDRIAEGNQITFTPKVGRESQSGKKTTINYRKPQQSSLTAGGASDAVKTSETTTSISPEMSISGDLSEKDRDFIHKRFGEFIAPTPVPVHMDTLIHAKPLLITDRGTVIYHQFSSVDPRKLSDPPQLHEITLARLKTLGRGDEKDIQARINKQIGVRFLARAVTEHIDYHQEAKRTDGISSSRSGSPRRK